MRVSCNCKISACRES